MERCVEMYCTEPVEWVQPLNTKSEMAYRQTDEFKDRLAMWPEDLRAQMGAENFAHLCDKHLPLYRGALGVEEEDLQEPIAYDATDICQVIGCSESHSYFVGIPEVGEEGEERIVGSAVCQAHVDTVKAFILAEEPTAEIQVKARDSHE